MKVAKKSVFRFLRYCMIATGGFFLLLTILALTTVPFYARYWLGTSQGCVAGEPVAIVLLSGSGMPSEDGLLRCYYTASLAVSNPRANVYIALPGDTSYESGSARLMKHELIIHGVSDSVIHFENIGRNTRQQAMQLAEMKIPGSDTGTIALVTSPEHMYRAILTFRKAGFAHVTGVPTFEKSVEDNNLIFNDKELRGNPYYLPIGKSKQLRYQFWNHLRFEILVIREYFAIAYYKTRAWI